MPPVVHAAASAVITATRSATDEVAAAAVAFAVSDPPSAEDLDRWRRTAEMPGLADATWTAHPGSDVRR